MGIFTLSDSTEFFDNVRRRSAIRIAHAEVYNVFAATASGHLELGSNIEDVRGETIDARETARSLIRHAFLE
jgi:hypothetical protein